MIEETQPLTGAHVNPHVKDATAEVRRGFIRKVYGILTAQLLLTALVAVPFQFVGQWWLLSNQWLLYLSVGMTIVTICAMTCCHEAARRYPTNYLLLFVFTAFEGVMVGFLSAQYTWQSVLLAAGVAAAIFLALTAFAWTSETDFTGMGVYLFAALMTLCLFGLVVAILSACGVYLKWMVMLYDIIGILIFVCYIVFDTQLILGEYGGHKLQFGIDDYAFAALNLYMDIIQLFMLLLRLLGNRR
eukprot:CAMPEP_0171158212 /NCGR_PEP_ID=MMETSP0790-20130122/2379_1 /TAXON_ID=2925 /ORGANISM="Alexandrium catenella, Strain OF101" /LENGTH=243 /DNA_ID=CAMNT_0011622615 /DNA_START=39 /DNA_END=770 /DNA_ORIENTATION=-